MFNISLTIHRRFSACGTDKAACSELCYARGDGFIYAIVIQVFSAICFVFSMIYMIRTMKVVVEYLKSKSGLFVWTEYNAASHLDTQVDSLKASLIFDITREKKFRVWFPFWNGLFEEMRNDKSPENINIQAIGKRWFQIKEQAQDSGVNRVNTWLNQEDPEILRARAVLCRGGHNAETLEQNKQNLLETPVNFWNEVNDEKEGTLGWQKYVAPTVRRGESVLRDHYGLEGIDVYCDKSCYTFDESKKGSHM
jgi:hypothetical protein